MIDSPHAAAAGFSDGSTRRGVLAGAGAALAGAVVWTVLVVITGYELGIVAVGIGLLVGLAMAAVAGPGRSRALPVIGAVLALAGCLLGNLFSDAYYFGRLADWSTLHTLGQMIVDLTLGRSIFSAGFTPIDMLFWAIAGYEGYKLTARGIARKGIGQARPAPAAAARNTPYNPPAPARHPSDFFTPPAADQPRPPAGT